MAYSGTELEKQKARERYWRNPERCRASSRRWKERHPEYVKRFVHHNSIRYLYGLSFEEYEELKTKQDNKCAICFSPPVERELDLDHSHTTNKARGLLCSRCNRLVALIEKCGTVTLEAAKEYLRVHAS